VPPTDVQGALRKAFEQWGLPERVRVDNGWPWGSSRDLPPFLALWLIGLGVGVIHNPARSPQDNGKVERFHGLIEPWGEPERCPNFASWQERLSWLSRIQREHYPAVGKLSRSEAFPSLAVVTRPYTSQQEAERWSLELVKAHLAQGRWRRRVDKVGRIRLYNRPYSVGRLYQGQEVFVGFNQVEGAWVIQDKTGRQIRRVEAREISAASIVNLEVSHRRRVPSTAIGGTT
jgi:transposase InsO family protein